MRIRRGPVTGLSNAGGRRKVLHVQALRAASSSFALLPGQARNRDPISLANLESGQQARWRPARVRHP